MAMNRPVHNRMGKESITKLMNQLQTQYPSRFSPTKQFNDWVNAIDNDIDYQIKNQ